MNRTITAHARLFVRMVKQRSLMFLLGLLTALEFFENAMFVFGASHIMGGISAAPREFAQIQAAYAVGSMLMIVNQQWLTRYFAYRGYLIVSLTLFVLGALGCSYSTSLGTFMISRFVQGFGGGALFISSRVLINLLFAPQARPKALKYFMMMIFSSIALGPIISAQCIDTWGWETIFLIAIPPALLAIMLCWLLLPETPRSITRPTFPTVSLLMFAAASICLQLVLSEARYDFFDNPVRLLIFSLIGGTLLVSFLWMQVRHPDPILMIRNLHNSVYLVGLGLYFLYYFLSNFSSYLFPIYAEQALSIPVTTVGWLNGTAGIFSVFVAYGYIKLARKVTKKKWLMIPGALAMAVTAWMFARLPPDATPAMLFPGLICKGFFSILLVLPIAGLTFKELGEQHFAHGYQGKNLMRQMAGSIATAIAAVVMENRQFTVNAELSATLTPSHPMAGHWLRNHPLSGNTTTALTHMAQVVAHQAQLIACQNLYLLLIVFSLITAAVIAVQYKIR